MTAGSAKTINAGAYFKVLFSGASCRLTTDTSANLKPYSQFWARVGGGVFTQKTPKLNRRLASILQTADRQTKQSHFGIGVLKVIRRPFIGKKDHRLMAHVPGEPRPGRQ